MVLLNLLNKYFFGIWHLTSFIKFVICLLSNEKHETVIALISVKRQLGRLAGFLLYVSNYDVSSVPDVKGSTLCYKDGPQLPLLNFTIKCTEIGRYVIFYNERLDGVIYPEGYEVRNIYTELCEVKVQGVVGRL